MREKGTIEKKDVVSIVVPVYNAEKYLHRCINSLLSQSYNAIEIILIDDGSSDSCGLICEDYAKSDKRVKVYHQPNQGVSAARQKGVDEAVGEFICFSDSDDWMDSDAIKYMYEKAIEDNADIVFCDYWSDDLTGCHRVTQCPSGLNNRTIFIDFLSKRLRPNLGSMLFKNSFIKRSGERFALEISLGEDYLYVCKLLNHEPRIKHLSKAF